jgi:hypothetical protein
MMMMMMMMTENESEVMHCWGCDTANSKHNVSQVEGKTNVL